MGTQVVLSSPNYSGFVADITFYAQTGGTISLGSHLTPYTVDLDYYFGTYQLCYSAFSFCCETSIIAPTPTPTNTPTPNVTPTPTITPSQVFYSYLYIPSNGSQSPYTCTLFSSQSGFVNSYTPLITGRYYCGAIPGFNSCLINVGVTQNASYPFIALTLQPIDCRDCS